MSFSAAARSRASCSWMSPLKAWVCMWAGMSATGSPGSAAASKSLGPSYTSISSTNVYGPPGSRTSCTYRPCVFRSWVTSLRTAYVPYSGSASGASILMRSPTSCQASPSSLTKMTIRFGHRTSATPAAVLNERPEIAQTSPRSMFTYLNVPPLQPTVVFWVQKYPFEYTPSVICVASPGSVE